MKRLLMAAFFLFLLQLGLAHAGRESGWLGRLTLATEEKIEEVGTTNLPNAEDFEISEIVESAMESVFE